MVRWYRLVDNLRPTRNVAVGAANKNDALDWGASFLKTTNIRIRLLKNRPKKVDYITPQAKDQ